MGNINRITGVANVNILTLTKGAVYICMSSSELGTLQRVFREEGVDLTRTVIVTAGHGAFEPRTLPIEGLEEWRGRVGL